MTQKEHKGITLIELLVVIAIIAILALIGLPNLLSAQVRAKVSRAHADLRVLAGALSAYHGDNLAYPPNDGQFNNPPIQLSTPIAYITNALLVDPFVERAEKRMTLWSAEDRYYTYMKIVDIHEAIECQNEGFPCPHEAIDHWSKNEGAFVKYGNWRLVSVGPDGKYLDPTFPYPLRGSDISYDPTNGTRSFGNILYTEKSNPVPLVASDESPNTLRRCLPLPLAPRDARRDQAWGCYSNAAMRVQLRSSGRLVKEAHFSVRKG